MSLLQCVLFTKLPLATALAPSIWRTVLLKAQTCVSYNLQQELIWILLRDWLLVKSSCLVEGWWATHVVLSKWAQRRDYGTVFWHKCWAFCHLLYLFPVFQALVLHVQNPNGCLLTFIYSISWYESKRAALIRQQLSHQSDFQDYVPGIASPSPVLLLAVRSVLHLLSRLLVSLISPKFLTSF